MSQIALIKQTIPLHRTSKNHRVIIQLTIEILMNDKSGIVCRYWFIYDNYLYQFHALFMTIYAMYRRRTLPLHSCAPQYLSLRKHVSVREIAEHHHGAVGEKMLSMVRATIRKNSVHNWRSATAFFESQYEDYSMGLMRRLNRAHVQPSLHYWDPIIQWTRLCFFVPLF